MKKVELKYTFINPNTPEETVRALQKIIVENIMRVREQKKLNTKPEPA